MSGGLQCFARAPRLLGGPARGVRGVASDCLVSYRYRYGRT